MDRDLFINSEIIGAYLQFFKTIDGYIKKNYLKYMIVRISFLPSQVGDFPKYRKDDTYKRIMPCTEITTGQH